MIDPNDDDLYRIRDDGHSYSVVDDRGLVASHEGKPATGLRELEASYIACELKETHDGATPEFVALFDDPCFEEVEEEDEDE